MDGSTAYNTVFIDTSLDTHLALIVSDVDTVSDLKKKIMYEHPLCFPNFGEIKIHALKVKRKGYFYHLTDQMFVKSAFDGLKKNWFLFIDASSLIKHDKSKLSSDPGSSNALLCITNGPLADGFDLLPDGTSKKLSFTDDLKLQEFESDHFLNQKVPMADHFGPDASIRKVLKDLEMEVKHISGDHCKTSSSDSSQKLDSGIQEKCDLISKGNDMLRRLTKRKKDNSLNGISDLQCNVPLEENIQSGAVSKKKSKTKRKFEALVESCPLKVNDGSIDASGKDILQQEITVPHNADRFIRDEPESADWARTQVAGMHAERDIDKLKEKVVDVQPNVLFGESSEADTAAKKKRKIEKKSKDPVNENEALICNSSKETSKPENIIPGITMDEKQETTTDTYDSLPTGPPQDNNLFCGNSNSKKKKKKSRKKPSNSYNDVAAAVPFSMEDVREENSKGTLGRSQKDSGKELDEAIVLVQSVQDAMLSEPCSNSLREKHNLTVQEVGIVREVLSYDIDTKEVDADKTGKEKESSQNNDPKVMLSEKSKPSGQDKTEMGMKELVISSKLLDDNGVVDTVKSAGRGKKQKKTKNTDRGMQLKSGIEHANSFVSGITSAEPLKAVDGGHSDKKAKKEENVLSQTARTEVAEIDTVNTLNFRADEEGHEVHGNVVESVQPMQNGKTEEIPVNRDLEGRKKSRKKRSSSIENLPDVQTARSAEIDTVNFGADEEGHEVHGNVVESVQPMQTGKTEEIPVNQDVEGRKKSRKKRSSSIENLPDVQMKEQNVGLSPPSIDKTKEADVPSKKKKKPDLVETGSENPINGSSLQSGKDTGNKSISGVDVETIKKVGGSISQGDIIKFSDYFLPSQQPHEVDGSAEAFDDKMIEAKRSERKMEAKKNSEKVARHSVGTSPDLQAPLRSNDNHGSETESGVGNSSTIQGSLRKDKYDKLMPGSKKRSSKVSDNKLEAQRSASRLNSVKASVTTTPAQANVNEIDKACAALSSSSEISFHEYKSQSNQKRMTARKASGDNSGKNVHNRGKSLLSISSSIFKDGNGDSSEDDGFVDSDASTRTPSDDSSSSDYSEVENKAGSQCAKRKADGGNSSGLKNMSLDAILKSSSRFKKAMITASQSQYEDIESQPVDFVPDSQANL